MGTFKALVYSISLNTDTFYKTFWILNVSFAEDLLTCLNKS